MERLFGLGCRLVVLACNTAAANALRRVQQEFLPRAYPDRRVLGVLVPMVEAITGVPWIADASTARTRTARPHTVAVFATRQTVLSNAYPMEIGKRAPEVVVVQQACSRLVDLIETGSAACGNSGVRRTLRRRIGRSHAGSGAGCRHVGLHALSVDRRFVCGRAAVGCRRSCASHRWSRAQLGAYLENHPEFDAAPDEPPPVRFFTSGAPERVSRQASIFFRPSRDVPCNSLDQFAIKLV